MLVIAIVGCKENSQNEASNDLLKVEEDIMEIKNKSKDLLKLGCYGSTVGGSTIKIEITQIDAGTVEANLFYAFAEKDTNEGTFEGTLKGDKLIGYYTFRSEGLESVRQAAFKVQKDQLVEGFGDMDENGMMFQNTTNLNYNGTLPWLKTGCN